MAGGEFHGDFAGRTVIVTGGSGGIGGAIVAAFAARRARVISADIGHDDEADANPAGVIRRKLDVTSEASWTALLDFAETHFEQLDVLVNNAGIYRPNIPFEEMPLELWQQHFAVNSDGVFLGCKHAILRMRETGGGSVVNIGSGMSITANPLGAAYCASKAAMLMTTRTAARAAGRHGIRVNAVLPGAVPTEMLMGNRAEGESDAQFLARMEAYSPLGTLAAPDDIARAVLFLADPANRAISGIHLPVDGGNIPGA